MNNLKERFTIMKEITTRQTTFKTPQNSTNLVNKALNHACMSWTMNNLKERFTIMKEITTRQTTFKMTILCYSIRM